MTTQQQAANVEEKDLRQLDWRVLYKTNTLINIAEMIDNGTASQDTVKLGIEIIEQTKGLIADSEFIPNEYKASMVSDMEELRGMYLPYLNTVAQ